MGADNSMNLKILDGIKINQNIVIWALSYIGTLYAGQAGMPCVTCICWLVFAVASLSAIVCLFAYTYEYVANKFHKAKSK